jgi:hypothetical protein
MMRFLSNWRHHTGERTPLDSFLRVCSMLPAARPPTHPGTRQRYGPPPDTNRVCVCVCVCCVRVLCVSCTCLRVPDPHGPVVA